MNSRFVPETPWNRRVVQPTRYPPAIAPDDEEGLVPTDHGLGQRRIGNVVGEILLASEVADERAPSVRIVIPNGAAEDGICRLERVEQRALRHGAIDGELYLSVDTGQRPQMGRQDDANHDGNVWTSTDNTAGRSRTIGIQLSPASDDT